MKKIELLFSPYELRFLKPFETSKGTVTTRRGLKLKIKNENGLIAYGDVAPFPEFGSETYDEAENCLKNFNHHINLDVENFELSFQKNFTDLEGYPALRCGIEQALLTLISAEKKSSINQIINSESRSKVNVNAVIPFNTPAISASTAEKYIEEGFTTLKIKAGRKDFSIDLKSIDKIRSAASEQIKLRIDVNGSWTISQAAENIKQLEKYDIEYIEQPVNSLEDFFELTSLNSIPLAADESVRNFKDAVRFIRSGAIKYLVLKPMMLGGITPLLSIYEEAKANNVKIVVSSSFESGIGYSYAVFAASLIQEDIAHGLATQHFFEARPLPEKYTIKNGVIHL